MGCLTPTENISMLIQIVWMWTARRSTLFVPKTYYRNVFKKGEKKTFNISRVLCFMSTTSIRLIWKIFFPFHLSIVPPHLFMTCLEYAMNVRGEKFNRMYRAKSPNVVYSGGTLTSRIFPNRSRHLSLMLCIIVSSFSFYFIFLFCEIRYMKRHLFMVFFYLVCKL